jgi:hypothetical protein
LETLETRETSALTDRGHTACVPRLSDRIRAGVAASARPVGILDECVGVTTDRTIWHTWSGAGGWTRMPGNGRADDINTVVGEAADGTRLVSVLVYGSSLWCQYYFSGSGWTGSWFSC